jgi:hypothetical protein
MGYFRFGLHSAFLNSPKPDAFTTMRAACRAGTYRPTRYTIFQVVPNMLLAVFRMQRNAWYAIVEVFEPVRHDACRLRSWLYPAPFATERAWLRLMWMPLVHRYTRRVFREDNEVCERLQQVVQNVRAAPRLGALEERIEWFEASYRRLIAEGEARMAAATGIETAADAGFASHALGESANLGGAFPDLPRPTHEDNSRRME